MKTFLYFFLSSLFLVSCQTNQDYKFYKDLEKTQLKYLYRSSMNLKHYQNGIESEYMCYPEKNKMYLRFSHEINEMTKSFYQKCDSAISDTIGYTYLLEDLEKEYTLIYSKIIDLQNIFFKKSPLAFDPRIHVQRNHNSLRIAILELWHNLILIEENIQTYIFLEMSYRDNGFILRDSLEWDVQSVSFDNGSIIDLYLDNESTSRISETFLPSVKKISKNNLSINHTPKIIKPKTNFRIIYDSLESGKYKIEGDILWHPTVNHKYTYPFTHEFKIK